MAQSDNNTQPLNADFAGSPAEVYPVVKAAPAPPLRINGATGEVVPAAPQEQDATALQPYKGISDAAFPAEVVAKLLVPVRDEEVEIRAHDGLIYVPGVRYRMRLNQAFGPGGWALRPKNLIKESKWVYYHGMLMAQGRFVAEAIGQSRYLGDCNEKVSYADAVESAKTDCMTRCCKDLGMFAELWDPAFGRRWVAAHAERGRDGKWYRKDASFTPPRDDAPDRHATAPVAPAPPAPDRPTAAPAGEAAEPLAEATEGAHVGTEGQPVPLGRLNEGDVVRAEVEGQDKGWGRLKHVQGVIRASKRRDDPDIPLPDYFVRGAEVEVTLARVGFKVKEGKDGEYESHYGFYSVMRLIRPAPAAKPAPGPRPASVPASSASAPLDAWQEAATAASNLLHWLNQAGFNDEAMGILVEAGITGKLLAKSTTMEQLTKFNALAGRFRAQNEPPADEDEPSESNEED